MVNEQMEEARTAVLEQEIAVAETANSERPHIRLEPSTGWVSLGLTELWRYRELLYFLVWRDIKVRYKQTALGAAWAVIQPFFTMIVFSVFFGGLANMPSDGLPYPLWSYAALVPWTFFATGLLASSNSLVGSQNLIKKVYFPRLAIPMGVVMAAAVDFVLAFGMLILMQIYYGIYPTVNVLWLPLFLVLAFMTALGTGLWLSAMNVKYRDVRYTVSFIAQFWMFATPIAWPSSLMAEKYPEWVWVLGFNPMAGVVESFRWALLGTNTAPTGMIGVSFLVAAALLVSGLMYFRRMEKTFADTV